MKRNSGLTKWIITLLLAALIVGALPSLALAEGAAIHCYVERPDNHGGDPGDPAADPGDMENFVFYSDYDGASAPAFLRSESLDRRFAHLISTERMADGSTNAYYARGAFRYEFDVFFELGEMTVLGETYTAGGDKYAIEAKYQQPIVFPGMENGLIPTLVETDQISAYCAGWLLDERAGEKRLLTYVDAVSESMLPTDDMPYDGLVYALTAVWFEGDDVCVLSSWYEEIPSEAGAAGVNRLVYQGKTYVNYPETDIEVNMPNGSKPSASSIPGLLAVACVEPDEGDEADNVWKFLYDRESFALHLDGGIGAASGKGAVPYQSNLAEFDPGWGEGTEMDKGGDAYSFIGWFQGDAFVSYSLAAIYMPPFDLALEAKWEAAKAD